MGASKRKREVSSCIPCYTRKQKCNRQYPCDHCTKRRRPEQCTYYPSQATKEPGHPRAADTHHDLSYRTSESSSAQSKYASIAPSFPKEKTELSSVAELFGYSEGSRSNTLALVQRLGVRAEGKDISLPPEVIPEVQRALKGLPSRPILDFLLQYFITEVNWIHQLLYPPWFLAHYQKWWSLDRPYSVDDIEFSVLFLKVCWYASQVLPSGSQRINSIRGVELLEIRKTCTAVAEILESICSQLDERGSLIRVQHLAVAGLAFFCQGKVNNFWASISGGIRVAQRIGMHLETTLGGDKTDQFEKELGRRTFCSLYVLDSALSFRMDHIPLIPHHLHAGNMPRMHLVPEVENSAEAPDMFAERIIQVKIVNFWKQERLTTRPEYDGLVAQERYDKFCTEFLLTSPPAFSLEPDTSWDSRIPKLCLQRQILRIAIFDSLCYNFRPALLQDRTQIEILPGYKKVLLSSHKKALASAALKVLESAFTLYDMMGETRIRCPGIIISIFEAAVALLCLYEDTSFLGETCLEACLSTGTPHPLSAVMAQLRRNDCLQAVKNAVERLQGLADLSKMAEAGARALASLIAKFELPSAQSQYQSNTMGTIDSTTQFIDAWNGEKAENIGGVFSMNDVLYGTSSTFPVNWEVMDDGSGLVWDKGSLRFRDA
ncbi:hypothetical protein F5Y12DRAFT_762797 [Xylaria sp. FL1777]|nr:hypothetical protein F5Y12DRAFT_762797 [Xylaria sp. FL1777]